MAKNEFVDLFDFGKDKKDGSEEEGTLATIIKSEETTVDEDTAIVGEKMIVESEAFVLKLYKKDGVIDSIDIECRCGRKAKIQLEYEKYSRYDDDEVDISDSEDKADTTQQKAIDESHEKEIDAEGVDAAAEQDAKAVPETPSEDEPDTETGSIQDADNADDEEFQEGLLAPEIPEQSNPEASPDQSETDDTSE